jgi:hypothetical protein
VIAGAQSFGGLLGSSVRLARDRLGECESIQNHCFVQISVPRRTNCIGTLVLNLSLNKTGNDLTGDVLPGNSLVVGLSPFEENGHEAEAI